MTAVLALRHQERTIADTRPWEGRRLAEREADEALDVREVAREVGDPGPGVEIHTEPVTRRPMAVVARLWLGVLSIFSLIVFGGLVVIILGAWAIGYRPVVVTSGSMEPTVRTGDVVITRPVHVDDELGDQTVIDFEDPVTAERRLHRVIEVTGTGYRTKGDANATADSDIVPPDHVRGAGFILAPFVGYLPMWAQDGAWVPLGISLVALIALTVMSRRAWMWTEPVR